MEKVYHIPIRMERDIVFKRMHIYETQPNYNEFLAAYNELESVTDAPLTLPKRII